MKKLSQSQKADLVKESYDLYKEAADIIGKPVPDTHACLYHACALQILMRKKHGGKFMMQAGTAQWPMMLPEDDDGVSATHYSYMWEGLSHPVVMSQIRKGELPEIHVWLAHRKPDTIIDPVSGFWPLRAEMEGFKWLGPSPPPFLWMPMSDFFDMVEKKYPLGVIYQPDLEATKVAAIFAEMELYPTLMAIV